MPPYNFYSVRCDDKCPIRLAGLCECTFAARLALHGYDVEFRATCNYPARSRNTLKKVDSQYWMTRLEGPEIFEALSIQEKKKVF